MYQKTSGIQQYYVKNENVPIPTTTTLDVRYVPNYGSAETWTDAALRAYLGSSLLIYGGFVDVSVPDFEYVKTATMSSMIMTRRGVFVPGSGPF